MRKENAARSSIGSADSPFAAASSAVDENSTRIFFRRYTLEGQVFRTSYFMIC